VVVESWIVHSGGSVAAVNEYPLNALALVRE